MGSPTELALEYRALSRVSVSCTSTNFSLTDDLPHEVHRLEDRLNALEEERRKIEAFRRELPLCMQLLHDAIEAYKEQLTFCKPSTQKESDMQRNSSFNDTDSNLHSPSDRIVMEEFIPLKRQCEGELPCKTMQKPNWMEEFVGREVRANSFSQERCLTDLTFERGIVPGILDQAFSTSSKPYFHSKHKSGGAFTPFSRDKQGDKQVVQPTPRLGTLNPTDLMLTNRDQEGGGVHHVTNMVGAIPKLGKGKPKENGQPHPKEVVTKIVIQGTNGSNDSPLERKSRRCWSPELHRCFVNALQQLGGSEVATPKQIRELMKVEGLTNDEVKSHLQKYRLHTRRPNPAQAVAVQGPPHVLVLGGIWVPPDYTAHAASQQDYTAHAAAQQASSSVYSQQQSHLCQPTSSQELYSELGQAHHNQHATSLPNITPAHSQCSMQGNPLQLMSDMAVLYHNSSLDDNTREESVGDDDRSGNSSCKGSQAMLKLGNAEEMEDDNRSQDGSITGDQSHCISEDGDSRSSETDLNMMMSSKSLREKK